MWQAAHPPCPRVQALVMCLIESRACLLAPSAIGPHVERRDAHAEGLVHGHVLEARGDLVLATLVRCSPGYGKCVLVAGENLVLYNLDHL